MVYLKKCDLIENLAAFFARELDFSCMHCHMFRQICLLGERLGASRLLATKWSLSSMNSQMVKKVMPLSKVFLAILKVTFENFHLTLRSRILVLKNSEVSRFWHFIFNFNWRKIKVLPTYDLNFGISRYLICDFSFLNLVTLKMASWKEFSLSFQMVISFLEINIVNILNLNLILCLIKMSFIDRNVIL